MIDFSLRISIFLLLLALLALWQWSAPRKKLQKWPSRWFNNFGLLLIGALCTRLIQPVLLSLVAISTPNQGLLHLINLPEYLIFLFSLLALDCLIYWQHRLFHLVPYLWRLHKVHHSDEELDVSSAVRFHPIEIILSLIIKSAAVWLLGISVEAILVFDIVLNGSAMFNHTNVRLSPKWEKRIRPWIVTPDMHRIHHSNRATETNSNYGFCLSIWDRLFSSYTKQSVNGDRQISIGLPKSQWAPAKNLTNLLIMPFIKNTIKSEQPPNKTDRQ